MKKDVAIALQIADALYQAVKESGAEGIPSGTLYSMIMGKISLDSYTQLINLLVEGKKIKNAHNLLVAI